MLSSLLTTKLHAHPIKGVVRGMERPVCEAFSFDAVRGQLDVAQLETIGSVSNPQSIGLDSSVYSRLSFLAAPAVGSFEKDQET